MEPTFDYDKMHSLDNQSLDNVKEEYSIYKIKSENVVSDEDVVEMESKICHPDCKLQCTLKNKQCRFNVKFEDANEDEIKDSPKYLKTEQFILKDEEECVFNVKVENVNEDKTEGFPKYLETDELILKDEEDEVHFCAVTNANPVPVGVPDRAAQTVPKDTLELRPSPININGFGIYTLRYFHKGVQFGPYEGKLTKVASTEGYSWKLIEGRLVDESDETECNYLRYINCAKDVSEQNLEAFQCKGEIYYRTCQDVTRGEELLIYFNNTSDNIYYKPQEENIDKEIYKCNFCHFGFVTEEDGDRHRCRFSAVGAEITNEKNGRYTRATSHPTKPMVLMKNSECDNTTNRKKSLKTHKPRNESDYETLDESERRSHRKVGHENKHLFNCGGCHLNPHKVIKRKHKNVFKCADCDFETCAKSSLNRHKNVKHKQKNVFNCADCDFETCTKLNLYHHKNTKHEGKNVFKCVDCDFETCDKSNLNRHKNAKHERKNVFKCAECDFETFDHSSLNRHRKLKHERKSLFRCNVKHDLKNLFKCADCEFESSVRCNLMRHRITEKFVQVCRL